MTTLRQRKPRQKDRRYLDSFRDRECENCGRNDGTTVPAHVRAGHEGGMGMKPDDALVCGLCCECHAMESADPKQFWLGVFKNMLRKRYMDWKSK